MISVRGREVEYSFDLLFLRVTCVKTSPMEMKEYLQYEFASKAPSLFEHGLMRKNTNSVLGGLIKGSVGYESYHKSPKELYVIDGGKFIKSGPWCESGTYNEICDEYIKYANKIYNPNSKFIMDGYDDINSIKKSEQARRIKGNVARNIVFTGETGISKFTKTEFLNNENNKKNFTKLLSSKLRTAGYEVTECVGDADYYIAEAALSLSATTEHQVIIDAADTDIIAMLVSGDHARENLVLQSLQKRYRISEIKSQLTQNIVDHILVTHAISGCDGTSALYNKAKKTTFKAVNNEGDMTFLNAFKSKDSTHGEIRVAGERFMLMIYSAPASVKSLDDLRYIRYKQQVAKKSLTAGTGFDLKSLPPTCDAGKYHSFRTYYQVQKYLGNTEICPLEWGWTRDEKSGHLIPIVKDQAAAPEKVLVMISCGCKQGCSWNCKCKNAGLECTVLCSGCNGRDCLNSGTDESSS